MAGREPVEVTVEIDGHEFAAGTLWVHEQRTETTTFRYSDLYLTSPASYDLDPALPKSAGIFQSPPGKPLFSAFADSAPDRWGQNLMRREERERAAAADSTPRSLRGADFLLA
jgi:serine/threonine-protein kinase HipA